MAIGVKICKFWQIADIYNYYKVSFPPTEKNIDPDPGRIQQETGFKFKADSQDWWPKKKDNEWAFSWSNQRFRASEEGYYKDLKKLVSNFIKALKSLN